MNITNHSQCWTTVLARYDFVIGLLSTEILGHDVALPRLTKRNVTSRCDKHVVILSAELDSEANQVFH